MEPATIIKAKPFQKNIIFCRQCKKLDQTKEPHKNHNRFKLPQKLLKRYIFDELIGSGQYGAVFKCFDLKLEYYKAIKMMFEINENDVAENDQKIMRSLNHQYIINYFDEGRNNQECWAYIIMELADMDLKKAIEDNIFDSLEKQMTLFKQICEGVEYIHTELEVIIYFFSLFLFIFFFT